MHIAAIVVRVLMLEQCGVISHSIWNLEDDTKYETNEDGFKYKPKKDPFDYDSDEDGINYKLNKEFGEYDSKEYDVRYNWTEDDFKYDSKEIDFNYESKKNLFVDYESKEYSYDSKKHIVEYDSKEYDFRYNWTSDDFKYESKEIDFNNKSEDVFDYKSMEGIDDYGSKEYEFKYNWTVDDFKSESEEVGSKYKTNGDIDDSLDSPKINDGLFHYDLYDLMSDPPELMIATDVSVNRLSRARKDQVTGIAEIYKHHTTTFAPNYNKASGATNQTAAMLPPGARFTELEIVTGTLTELYFLLILFLIGVILSPIGWFVGSAVVMPVILLINFIFSAPFLIFPPFFIFGFYLIIQNWAVATFFFLYGWFYAASFAAAALFVIVTTSPLAYLALKQFLKTEYRQELAIFFRLLKNIEDFLIRNDQNVREYILWKFQYLPFLMNIKFRIYKMIHNFIFKTFKPFIRRIIAQIRLFFVDVHLKKYNEIWLSYQCHFKRFIILVYVLYQGTVRVTILIDKALTTAAIQLKENVLRIENATIAAANATLVALQQMNNNVTRRAESVGKWLDEFSDRNLNSTEVLLARLKSLRRSGLDWFKYLLLGDGGPGGWIVSFFKSVWGQFEQKCALEYL